ncbi:MAG: hypothetical protein IT168_28645 [Bryobacterales bacterium]|nr:hypothetical protein [Bryobacterales bacterium]
MSIPWRRLTLAAIGVFALNLAFHYPYATLGYTNFWSSNEGAFLALARAQQTQTYGPADWWPYWNAGLPFVNTYQPALPKLTAWLANAAHIDVVHAYHFITATALTIAPLAVFALAFFLLRSVSGAIATALAYSLLSPAALIIPRLREGSGEMWGLRRLHSALVYGEAPHVVALALTPLAWLAFAWMVRSRRFGALLVTVILASALALTNSYAAVAFAIGCALYLLAADLRIFSLGIAAAAAIATYIVIAPWWPPMLLRTLAAGTEAVAVGGHARRWWAIAIVVSLILTRRILNTAKPATRYAVLTTLCFGAIVVLSMTSGVNVLFHGYRYQHEFDFGVALLLGIVCSRRRTVMMVGLALTATLFVWNLRVAHRHAIESRYKESLPYQVSKVLEQRYPNRRVMATSSEAFWLNEFTNLPQLSGGHDPMGVNRAQMIAVYTIYTGDSAGAHDADISIAWLRAFGAAAIFVPGRHGRDDWKPFANPSKFEGKLPLVWQSGDDRIYELPTKSSSLAHTIPKDALVECPPVHGLDTFEVERYVNALDTEPGVLSFDWQGPSQARIHGQVPAGNVVSIQINHYPGWTAKVNGRPTALHADGIGLMWLDPRCGSGGCEIELTFRHPEARRSALWP